MGRRVKDEVFEVQQVYNTVDDFEINDGVDMGKSQRRCI